MSFEQLERASQQLRTSSAFMPDWSNSKSCSDSYAREQEVIRRYEQVRTQAKLTRTEGETNWAGGGLVGGSNEGGEATDGSIYCHRSLLTAFVLIKASQHVQSFGDFRSMTAESPEVAIMMMVAAVCQIPLYFKMRWMISSRRSTRCIFSVQVAGM